MAKRDEKDSKPTRRVYKSSDVHKRRVGDSSRAKPAKLPSKREARESARESQRISAEARMGEMKKRDRAIDSDADNAPGPETEIETASETQETREAAKRETQTSGRPRFTVVKRPQDLSAEPVGQVESTESIEPADSARSAEPMENTANSRRPASPRRRLVQDAAGKLSSMKPSTIAIGVLLVLAVIAVAVFAYNRWIRYDDRADLQGTWYVLGTETPITIDGETIYFNDEVSYQYDINSREKTISYTFGPMSGQGRYWFSDDRSHLVITDGDSYTAAGTTVDDLIHAFLDLSTSAGGGIVELPQGEGIVAFSRTPEKVLRNEPAEGLVVPLSSESTSPEAAASEEEPTAEQATGEEAAADEAAGEEELSAEGGSQDEAYVEEAALEQSNGETGYEEEAA